MDVVMADGADHEGLASFSCHELGPWWLWLSGFVEMGELADVVDFYLAGVLAHLTSSVWSRSISSLRWMMPGGGLRSIRTALRCRLRAWAQMVVATGNCYSRS